MIASLIACLASLAGTACLDIPDPPTVTPVVVAVPVAQPASVQSHEFGIDLAAVQRYLWNLDARTLIESAEQWVTGYQGEAAFAMHYGLPIDCLLVDDWAQPDFTFRGRNIDVKTTTTHLANRIHVRADILGKDLSTWWIVAASSTVGSNDVALLGFLPARELTKYPTKAAAEGHDKPYIVIPADDFLAMPEKAT